MPLEDCGHNPFTAGNVASDTGQLPTPPTFAVPNTLVTENGAFTFTGSAATLRISQDYLLAVDSGTFSFTGTAATLLHIQHRSLAAGSGSFAFTGTDATLTHAVERMLAADSGAFTFTGTAADLTADQARLWAQVDSWTHSGNVTTVDFPSSPGLLDGYTEFLVIGRGVALTGAGSRRIRVSDDGGSTWFDTSGDYQDIDNAGVETNADGLSLNSASATTASDFAEHIVAANLSTPPKILERRTRTGFGASVTTGVSVIDGIRIYATTGDFSAGTIRVYAR